MLSLFCLTFTVIVSINGALECDDCFGHGECRVNQGNPTCYCFAGYIGKQCQNKTSITLNGREPVDSDNIFSFKINNDDNVLYDLDFMHDKSYSFQDEQGEIHIDLHFDLQTTSITLFDSVLAHQGVTVVNQQHNSTTKTKINLLCPSDIDISVDSNNIFYKYQVDTEYELNLFTPLACPIDCISYNDETNEYQQCNGHGICSFDPTIQQTHCLCQDGYDTTSQCAILSVPTRRRLTELPESCKRAILEAHNDIRKQIRDGRFTWTPDRLDPPLNTQTQTFPTPAAGVLLDLQWSDNLEKQASSWADLWPLHPERRLPHSNPNRGKSTWDRWQPEWQDPYGENLAYRDQGTRGRIHWRFNVEDICGSMAERWFVNELSWYLWGTFDESQTIADKWNAKYPDEAKKTKAQIGHLTQVISGDTREIGCGYYQIDTPTVEPGGWNWSKIDLVCHYFPSGNYPTEPYRTLTSEDIEEPYKTDERAGATSSAGPLKSAPPGLEVFQTFLRNEDYIKKQYGKTTINRDEFITFVQEQGFHGDPYSPINLARFWRSVMGGHAYTTHVSKEVFINLFKRKSKMKDLRPFFKGLSSHVPDTSDIRAYSRPKKVESKHSPVHQDKLEGKPIGGATSSAGPSKKVESTFGTTFKKKKKHSPVHQDKSEHKPIGGATSSAGPSKSAPPGLANFQGFLRNTAHLKKQYGETINRAKFITVAQREGFRGDPYSEKNLGRFWDSVMGRLHERPHYKTNIFIRLLGAKAQTKTKIEHLQQYFTFYSSHVQKYDNYYNDEFYDGKMDKSAMDPYFYVQFQIFNFVEIFLQSLILILVFMSCICGGFALFIISNATKRNKSNNNIGYDAVDHV